MLGSIRKFSQSIFAKIFLGLVAIPFIFWGMGSVFTSGTKNIVVIIDKDKHSTKEFFNYIQENAPSDQKIKAQDIDEFLLNFIGSKLMEKEAKSFNIRLTDKSLGQLIKNQPNFKREENFSRTEYEKFLLTSNMTPAFFEKNLSEFEQKKQLINLIGGGLIPPKFLVSKSFNSVNQKRSLELININDLLKKQFVFSEEKITSNYEKNKNKYQEIYKSIKLLELDTKKLTASEEFTDVFFKKIDEIDEMIMQGKNFDFIIKKFNLENPNLIKINKIGKGNLPIEFNDISEKLLNKIFKISEENISELIEFENKYYLVEIIKTENLQRNIDDNNIRKAVIENLKKEVKQKFVSELISKINSNNFAKSDFDELSKKENVSIQKIKLQNKNDNKILESELVNEIYNFAEKRVMILHDINFNKNFLVYINKIENTSIDENSDDYKEYLKLSKIRLANDIYNTYDIYIKNKYEIDINYKALEVVKNSVVN